MTPSREALEIVEDGKFFSRLLSKENSATNPSFRVYYGVAAGAVPFLWESQPGTPKHPMAAGEPFLPLNPPPSYYRIAPKKSSARRTATPKLRLLHAMLPKLTISGIPLSPFSPKLSSSSSSSSASTISSGSRRRGHCSSPRSSLSSNSRGDDEEFGEQLSPTSTLCFRKVQPEQLAGGKAAGCYPRVGAVKKALMSMIGQGNVRP
ncbi:alkylated DNA repair protein [Apostasia shenzhenica]|uniref:Alkylated DNA repair protein n=1 Tax=Apostasia shenzhenica TaxID=1088818 RepID=A0A2I0BH68_9ASPA|nr:alkylated DNA repair protein [Apostasia shenzhenica]